MWQLEELEGIIAETNDIEDAITARHAEGYLSDRQHAEQLEVLRAIRDQRLSIPQLRRVFIREAVKGEATIRWLETARAGKGFNETVADIDWLCAQRLGTNGWVHETIRPEVQAYRFPYGEDLHVFRDEDRRVLAILDHRERQEPYPGASWPAGWYYVLYVDPRWDRGPDRGKCPELIDWSIRTLRPFRPYRQPGGRHDLEAYVRAEHAGSALQLARARQLVRLCAAAEHGADLDDEDDDVRRWWR